MRENKYILKYTLPNHFTTNEQYISFTAITCGDENLISEFYESFCNACVSDIKNLKGIVIEPKDIDFKLISLIDSVPKK